MREIANLFQSVLYHQEQETRVSVQILKLKNGLVSWNRLRIRGAYEVPLNAYKIKLVDSQGYTVGYECEICGKRYIMKGFGGCSAAGL